MNRRNVLQPVAVAALVAMAGCATVPSGPNVMVLPGAQKNFDQFRADQESCQQYAQSSIGGYTAGENAANSAVSSAVVGTALGAAVGAIIGSATGQAGPGAAIGAGTGLLFGSVAGSNAAGLSYYQAQRRYDMAYVQCMYARGNEIPGRAPSRRVAGYPGGPSYPPPNTAPPNLSQGYSPAPPVASARPPYAGSASGYPSLPSSAAGALLAPPADYPAASYPPPNTPPPSGVAPPRG